jgi:hypothetical protein
MLIRIFRCIRPPKPMLSVYGYGHEELVFFEVQPTPSYLPNSDNGRMGRITILGGSLSVDERTQMSPRGGGGG